jgi:hypothetical protein
MTLRPMSRATTEGARVPQRRRYAVLVDVTSFIRKDARKMRPRFLGVSAFALAAPVFPVAPYEASFRCPITN